MRPVHPAKAARTFLRTGLTAEQAAAMNAANPYKQRFTRQWFEAGWFAYGLSVKLGEGITLPGMSSNARVAYGRGIKARVEFELAKTTGEKQ